MPEGTRVHDCVDKLKAEGKPEGHAIAICQASTHQGYATGRTLKKKVMPQKLIKRKSIK